MMGNNEINDARKGMMTEIVCNLYEMMEKKTGNIWTIMDKPKNEDYTSILF